MGTKAKDPRMPAYGRIYQGDQPAAKRAAEIWTETIEHMNDATLKVTKLRLHTIDRYVRARIGWGRLFKETRKLGPITKTRNGNEQFSYKWSAMEKLEDRILKFEKELLITPAAAQDRAGEKKAPANDAAANYGL